MLLTTRYVFKRTQSLPNASLKSTINSNESWCLDIKTGLHSSFILTRMRSLERGMGRIAAVALPVREIIGGTYKLGQSLDTPTLPLLQNFCSDGPCECIGQI